MDFFCLSWFDRLRLSTSIIRTECQNPGIPSVLRTISLIFETQSINKRLVSTMIHRTNVPDLVQTIQNVSNFNLLSIQNFIYQKNEPTLFPKGKLFFFVTSIGDLSVGSINRIIQGCDNERNSRKQSRAQQIIGATNPRHSDAKGLIRFPEIVRSRGADLARNVGSEEQDVSWPSCQGLSNWPNAANKTRRVQLST